MAEKKPESPERDSQLWIHQRGSVWAPYALYDESAAQFMIIIKVFSPTRLLVSFLTSTQLKALLV